MGTKTARRLNLSQCIRLQQNNFLSVDQDKDYDHDEVIAQMIKLQSSSSERKISKLMKQEQQRQSLEQAKEVPPPIPYEAMINYVEEINF